jgi:predicted GIY-YIG superfamily endonuclease
MRRSQVRFLSAPPAFARNAARAKAAAPERSEGGRDRTFGPAGYGSASQHEFLLHLHLAKHSNTGTFLCRLTDDLKQRLTKHNSGEIPHTSKFKPWRIKTAIAFTDRSRAAAFERYLKSASGRTFAKKRL